MHVYVNDMCRNFHKCTDMSVQLHICIYMYIHGIYMFTIVCTGIKMYIHGIDLYILLCQILSIWSGFQMGIYRVYPGIDQVYRSGCKFSVFLGLDDRTHNSGWPHLYYVAKSSQDQI